MNERRDWKSFPILIFQLCTLEIEKKVSYNFLSIQIPERINYSRELNKESNELMQTDSPPLASEEEFINYSAERAEKRVQIQTELN